MNNERPKSKSILVIFPIAVVFLGLFFTQQNNEMEAKKTDKESESALFTEEFLKNSNSEIQKSFNINGCVIAYDAKKDSPFYVNEGNFQINLKNVAKVSMQLNSARSPYMTVNIDEQFIRVGKYTGHSNILNIQQQKEILTPLYKSIMDTHAKCAVN